jgi:hypothetical protein
MSGTVTSPINEATQSAVILSALTQWAAAKPGRSVTLEHSATGWRATLHRETTAHGLSAIDCLAQAAQIASFDLAAGGARHVSGARLEGRQWVDFDLPLPAGATVEIEIASDGNLSCQIECHNDVATLAVLANALRAAVVEVDTQRGRVKT